MAFGLLSPIHVMVNFGLNILRKKKKESYFLDKGSSCVGLRFLFRPNILRKTYESFDVKQTAMTFLESQVRLKSCKAKIHQQKSFRRQSRNRMKLGKLKRNSLLSNSHCIVTRYPLKMANSSIQGLKTAIQLFIVIILFPQ